MLDLRTYIDTRVLTTTVYELYGKLSESVMVLPAYFHTVVLVLGINVFLYVLSV